MRIVKLPVGPFEVNCFIIADEQTGECILIDPGDEPQKIIDTIEQNKLKPTKIINTHNHIDHIRHLSQVKDYFKIPFLIHEDDLPLVESLKEQALFFGMDSSDVPEVDQFLNDGDKIKFNQHEIKVLHTPGHSPGSISLYFPNDVFVGDVLFKESVGRTDLYGGNFQTLMESISKKLLTLPDETTVHSGHGPDTTIGYEKQHNPFLKDFLKNGSAK